MLVKISHSDWERCPEFTLGSGSIRQKYQIDNVRKNKSGAEFNHYLLLRFSMLCLRLGTNSNPDKGRACQNVGIYNDWIQRLTYFSLHYPYWYGAQDSYITRNIRLPSHQIQHSALSEIKKLSGHSSEDSLLQVNVFAWMWAVHH